MDAGKPDDVGLLLRLMSASTARARVIAGNIANENTPGYRRQVLHFEEMLRGALRRGDELGSIEPQVEPDFVTPARADGNNVNLELELNADRQNRVLYETYAAILQSHFELLRTGIENGR